MFRDFLTTPEASSVLGLHTETIKRLCRLTKLKGEKVNNGWLIPRTEVESFASTYSETRGRSANRHACPDSGDRSQASSSKHQLVGLQGASSGLSTACWRGG